MSNISGRKIGAGAYATVYGDGPQAYKLFERGLADGLCHVLRESLALRLGYGVALRGLVVDAEVLAFRGLHMEKAFTTLHAAHICSESEPDLEVLLTWTRQLLLALAKLHASRVVHGDIKPGNILLRNDGAAELCDFGLSARTTAQPSGAMAGIRATNEMYTITYRPPEMLVSEGPWQVEPAADVWSLGVSIFEALQERLPWHRKTTANDIFEHLDKLTDLDASVRRKNIRAAVRLRSCPTADVLVDMLTLALAPMPQERPTAWSLYNLITTRERVPAFDASDGVVFGLKQHFSLRLVPATLGAATAATDLVASDLVRTVASNVAKVVLLEPTETFFGAVEALCAVLAATPQASGLPPCAIPVVAATLCTFLLLPSHGVKMEWLAKLASMSASAFSLLVDQLLVAAIQSPEWSHDLWLAPADTVALGPDLV